MIRIHARQGHAQDFPTKVFLSALLFLLSAFPFASDDAILGSYEGWLDRMGAGVRELGRGNTGTALVDGGPAAYCGIRPCCRFQRDPAAGVGAQQMAADRTGGYLFFQERLTGNLGFGFGVINRGDLYSTPAYDADENYIGTVRPEDFASYLGVGLRTSRQNSFGVTVQWYTSNLDVGGLGHVDFVGGVNLGWYHRFPDSVNVAVVVRNLGFNQRLSAEFNQNVITDQSNSGFESSATDFFPKTLVLAGEWHKSLFQRAWTFSAEGMDYQLQNELFSPNPAFHTQALRLGAECEVAEHVQLRAGDDRGDLTLGFGYAFPWHRRQLIQFDYAQVVERVFTSTGFETLFFDPFAIGLKTTF